MEKAGSLQLAPINRGQEMLLTKVKQVHKSLDLPEARS
jgi:hypothetical protein